MIWKTLNLFYEENTFLNTKTTRKNDNVPVETGLMALIMSLLIILIAL